MSPNKLYNSIPYFILLLTVINIQADTLTLTSMCCHTVLISSCKKMCTNYTWHTTVPFLLINSWFQHLAWSWGILFFKTNWHTERRQLTVHVMARLPERALFIGAPKDQLNTVRWKLFTINYVYNGIVVAV